MEFEFQFQFFFGQKPQVSFDLGKTTSEIIWEDFFDRIQNYGCLYWELAWERPIQLLYKIILNLNNFN